MKKFIAYFDYLGFKDFIEKNDLNFQIEIMNNNFRDIEDGIAQGKHRLGKHGGYVADLSKSTLNAINFSDTIVIWTNDDSLDSFMELLEAAYRFNHRSVTMTFPIRGMIVLDELESVAFNYKNNVGGSYNINSVFGKGLVKAHLQAEQQQWAGTVIGEEIIDKFKNDEIDIDHVLKPFAQRYKVPYKPPFDIPYEEYALKLVTGINDEFFKNVSKGIVDNFSQYNKDATHESVQEKLSNTIKYLSDHGRV
ncbi:hypothetical protein [Pedobacter gandavensis]|uniref:hypothetical protein n=1 Tax=Pedobacter gandavensis TaxID=2679963 RepID=UPI00292D0A57|nr:hypothetical protein [Pedobacter gandavensis]